MFPNSPKPCAPACRMTDIEPTPGQTLAVLLGAGSFRYAPKLACGSAFNNSSQQFEQYLTGTMGVPEKNVESFFNDRRPASEQLRDIRDFLERRGISRDGWSSRR